MQRVSASTFRAGEIWAAGFVYVYQQKDAGHYETIGKIPSRGGAGTSFWSPDLDRYYVAAPATEKGTGSDSVYALED